MHLLKVVLIVGLLICFGIQIYDHLSKFVSKQTMLSVSNRKYSAMSMPAITVCPNPAFKRSAKALNVFDFMNIQKGKGPSMPLPGNLTLFEAWNKTAFVFGDSVRLNKLGHHPDSPQIQVEIINTFFFGSCFTLFNNDMKLEEYDSFGFMLVFPVLETPEYITILLHDFEDRYAFATSGYVYGTATFEAQIEAAYTLALRRTEKWSYNNGNCTDYTNGMSKTKCMTMKFAEFYIQDPIPEMLNEKCIGVKKCKIPQVESILKLAGLDSNVSDCSSFNRTEVDCMSQWFYYSMKEFPKDDCLDSCYGVKYEGIQRKFNMDDMYKSIFVNLEFYTYDVEIQEELLIYDFISITSAAGGSLGLFIGFSFLDCGSFLLDFLLKKASGTKNASN